MNTLEEIKRILKVIERESKKAQTIIAQPQQAQLNSNFPYPEKTLVRVSAIIKNFNKDNSNEKLKRLIGYLGGGRSQKVQV